MFVGVDVVLMVTNRVLCLEVLVGVCVEAQQKRHAAVQCKVPPHIRTTACLIAHCSVVDTRNNSKTHGQSSKQARASSPARLSVSPMSAVTQGEVENKAQQRSRAANAACNDVDATPFCAGEHKKEQVEHEMNDKMRMVQLCKLLVLCDCLVVQALFS